MKCRLALALAAVVAGAPLAAKAETAIGGSYGWSQQAGGQFAGNSSGYKAYVGTYIRGAGAEAGFVNFGNLGGDGPHAQAWTSGFTIGFPVRQLSIYGKIGLALSRVSGTATSEEVNRHRMYYGGGMTLGGQKGFGLRGEYERFKLTSESLDFYSLGLEYRF